MWFSPNPLTLEPGVSRKGGEADVARGIALYVDLDVVTPDVKDKGLASLSECEQVVEKLTAVLGCAPVVVIESGHGLQPIWRVRDAPLITDGAVAWKTISARWAALVRQVAAEINPKGHVDSIFNIDRVLRCPGSTNWKVPDEPVPARGYVNADAGWLDVAELTSVLPEAPVASPVHQKGSPSEGQAVLDGFRSGAMSTAVAGKVREVEAAIEDGADRHSTMNSATLGLVRLGAKGEPGVRTALITVEALFEAVSDSAGHDPDEFQRSLTGALRVVAGDPDYVALDFYTGGAFEPGGIWGPGSGWIANEDGTRSRGMVAEVASDEDSVGVSAVLERFPLVGAAEMARPIPPIEWLIRGAWPRNSFGPIAGAKKTLKSYNAIAFALAVASGAPLLDQFEVVTPGPVLYLNGEGGRNLFHRRTQAIAKRYGVPLPELPLYAVHVSAPLDSPDFLGAVRHYLDEVQPELVILDPLYAYHPKGVDAANVYERGPMLAEFREQTVGDEAALLVADHFNKGAKELDLDSIGYAGMSAWADSWWVQRHARNGPNLETGEYPLEVQFGSRQWGGRQWNVNWRLPPLDQMDRAEEGEAVDLAVDWSVSRMTSVASSPEAAQASLTMQIYNLVKAQPGQLTKTAVKASKDVKGRGEARAAEVDRMLDAGMLRMERKKLWAMPITFGVGDEP
ncbi:hypothetical protein AXK56_15805 [Tsukamurella pulmonis]|nr:hypothetical protein AXK56_15805 [Tsukamurella pulmonis]